MTDRQHFKTLAEVPAARAAIDPNGVALRFNERSTTFRDLDRFTNQIANRLSSDGLTDGARIAYLGKNSDTWVQVLYGVAKAADVLVSVNWRLAPPEISYILNDAHAAVLVVAAEYAPTVEKIREELPDLKQVLVVDGDGVGVDFEGWRDEADVSRPEIEVRAESIVLQQYTSGTTGRPKGAQLSHRNLIANFEMDVASSDCMVFRGDQVYLSNMPQFHISGPLGAYASLSAGAMSIVLDEFDPREMLRLIDDYAVKSLWMVPAMLQMLLDQPSATTTDFTHVEYVQYGAAPMPVDLLCRAMDAMDCKFIQGYGLTEHSGPATRLQPEDHERGGNERMQSVGTPMPGVELRLIDEDWNDVPLGEIGEICLKSDAVMAGYWNLPDANAEVLRDGWLRTGDAAVLDSDGYVYLKDRVKDMIVAGGENIYPAEVENALYGHPSIAEVAVIGVPDERWGEVPKGIVVLQPGAELDAKSLLEHAAARIARFKLPKSFDVIDVLPRNPSGKVLRHELRKRYTEAQ